MQRINLDFSGINDKETLHEHVAVQFALPAEHARNLDALWDLLMQIQEYTLVELRQINALYDLADSYSVQFLKILDDAAQENEYIWLKVKEDI